MYYTLNEKKEVVRLDVIRENWEKIAKKILESTVGSKIISTIFFGVGDKDGKQLFETMIFEIDDKFLAYQERCDTYDEALKQHADAINHIRRKINEI